MPHRLTLAFALGIGSLTAATEIGTINGAAFRIDVPDNWNGGLVMYCHGYNARPATFAEGPANAIVRSFLDRGMAIAQSGYAAGGWAVAEAVTDTESLRRYFVTKHGKAKETWVAGHSMGGLITIALMEKYPTVYAGGLPLCGVLDGAYRFFQSAFHSAVLFDFYFPGQLPSLVDGAPGTGDTRERVKAIVKALDAEPAKAEALRRRDGFKTNEHLAVGMLGGAGALAELRSRAGGNPLDNTNYIYTGTLDDNAANAGVKRHAADPAAAAYLRAHYAPTGAVARPVLAIHTTYDPTVPPATPNGYALTVAEAGNAHLFLQQFVQRDGHCAINAAETAKGFDELRRWALEGIRPAPGDRTQTPPPAP
jgi:pimeloyl-ACP methyl ester carboxylesterase